MLSLRNIIERRRGVFQPEPYNKVIWFVCLIDIIALLSCSGKGDFIGQMMQKNLVPSSDQLRETSTVFQSDSSVEGNWDIMSTTWTLLREIVLHAARIGQFSRQNRDTVKPLQEQHQQHRRQRQREHSGPIPQIQISQWQQQATTLRDGLKQAWSTHAPAALISGYNSRTIPGPVRDLYEFVSHSLQACERSRLGV